MQTYKTPLAAKVAARNIVNKTARDMLPAMLAALAPFVGQKVVLATGQLSAKVKAALPQSDHVPGSGYGTPQWWYDSGAGYTLRATVKVCCGSEAKGYTSGHYAEQDISLGELDKHSGTLVKLCDGHVFPSDFTEAGVIVARTALRIAQKALDDARGLEIHHFGEHDNF